MQTGHKPMALGKASEALTPLPCCSPLTCAPRPPPPTAFPSIPTNSAWQELEVQPPRRNMKRSCRFGNQPGSSSKGETYDPAIPPLGIDPKEMKIYVHPKICIECPLQYYS